MSRLHKISGCDNAARKADVLFIHGLGGDAFDTWRCDKNDTTSWPYWLGSEFPNVGVWSLGYAASPTKWPQILGLFSKRYRNAGHSMALPDRALQVLDQMVHTGLGLRPLLFICHSLGGLVAKQILRKADDADDESKKKQVAIQTRAVLFLATPHTGAKLASLANAFRTVFGASVNIEDLRAHDAHLRDLFDWYRNRSVGLDIQTATYYERRNLKGVAPIVTPSSAHPGVGADPVPLDEDHLSISKPSRPDAQVCCAANELLRSYVLAPSLGKSAQLVSPVTSDAQPDLTTSTPCFPLADSRPGVSEKQQGLQNIVKKPIDIKYKILAELALSETLNVKGLDVKRLSKNLRLDEKNVARCIMVLLKGKCIKSFDRLGETTLYTLREKGREFLEKDQLS